MYFTGFADEAAPDIERQIQVTQQLGWHYIESRNINGRNIHDLSEAEFEAVAAKLDAAGIKINCFGSSVANWACDPFKTEDFERTKGELQRALVRMKKLGCTMLRGMSFMAQWERPRWDAEVEAQVFPKVAYLVKMCEDAGVLYLHENCKNYGGMSYKHTLKLLDKISSPNFKLIFDTGNPVLNYDRSEHDELDTIQNSWEFYRNVREFIYYVHIKDAVRLSLAATDGWGKARFTFPGEGQGCVKAIVADLLHRGYDGGFSMEPHMMSVFHAPDGSRDVPRSCECYVKYGQKFMKLVADLKKEL